MMKTMRRILVSTAAVALAITAGQAAAQQKLPTNKQLTVGITQEFETFNPLSRQMSASTYMANLTMHPIVAIDAKWQYQCWLCVRIPSIENGGAMIITEGGKKKLTAEWEIKPDAKWGDGKPVTGNDVKLAWELGSSPNVSVGDKDVYTRVEKIAVDAKNPKKFTMTLKEARYDFYQLGTFAVIPAHLEGPIWAKTKTQTGAYEKQTTYVTNPTNPGLYNGPYVIKEIKLGSHVVMERNPTFYAKQANIERVIFKLIPDTATLEANLLAGTIDMISELGMTFDQALAFEKRLGRDKALAQRFNLLFAEGMTYEHLDFNLSNPILADINVRKAMVHAIDRDRLTKALFEGRQKKAIHNVHPRDVYFTEDVTKYDYDMKKAEALLEVAGWKKGADGTRTKDGQKLALVIMTTAQNKSRELVQTYLQAEWKKVGIDVSIKNEPARVFFGETMKKRAFPGIAMYAWVSSPDNPPRSTLHSSQIPTQANGFSGQNFPGWANTTVDKLFDEIVTEFDVNKRKAMMQQILKAYTEEVPVMPLYMRADIAVTPKNLTGFEITGHQFQSTLSIDKWNLETGTKPAE